jgi:hypothetical protein
MQVLPGTGSTGDLPTSDRVRLLGFGNRGANQPTAVNGAIDRRSYRILQTCQRAMRIVIEI